MPTISVVIPTFNRASYLIEAIESVLNQTYKDYEIIVVDDGSTDGTRGSLEGYSGKIRYALQENQGPSSARNLGIEMAKGIFIAFLDSDDTWEPEKLQRQMEMFQRYPSASLIYTNFRYMGEYDPTSALKLIKAPSGMIAENLLEQNFIVTPSVMVRKAVLKEAGGFDQFLTTLEDYDLWLKIAIGHPIYFLDDYLVTIRKHPDNLSNDALEMILSGIRVIQKTLSGDYGAHVSSLKKPRRKLGSLYYRAGKNYIKNGHISQARRCFLKSWLIYPRRVRRLRNFIKTFF